jgi:hypothetical protein
MGTKSPRLGRVEQGGLPRVDPLGLETWARRPIIAVSRNRVPVRYNCNRPRSYL